MASRVRKNTGSATELNHKLRAGQNGVARERMTANRLRFSFGRKAESRQLIPHSQEECLGEADALGLAGRRAFPLDADVTMVTRVQHDLHHLEVVDLRLVSVGVERVGLGTDALGIGHELADALVLVVPLALVKMDVP